MNWPRLAAISLAVLCSATSTNAVAQALSGSGTPVEFEHVAGNVYMLSGGGGANSSLLVGADGALLVDSKSPAATAQIVAIANELSGGSIRYLLNGHVHPDHTNGNANFGSLGATIIAHEQVREVLAGGQRGGPPSPDAALPVITFPDSGEMSLHLNGESVQIFHAPPAHSHDNSIVHYRGSNVLHLGDLFSPSRYPVIAGGTFDGFIGGINLALEHADADTKVIPGVGAVASHQQLMDFRDMLVAVRDRVADLVADGNTLEEIIAAQPTREFDAVWGAPDHRLFLPIVYSQLGGQ